MPKKKTKVSKKDKQAARKKADELVGVGNGHLENALAARKQKNIVATLERLALAENSYLEATKVNISSVHLDSLYNLGVLFNFCPHNIIPKKYDMHIRICI